MKYVFKLILVKQVGTIFSKISVKDAAICGYLNVITYHHEKDHFFPTNVIAWAASNGHLEVVQWLHENRCEEGYTTYAMNWAAAKGHLEVAKWLHENRHEGCTINVRHVAIVNGHEDVVQWLRENGHYMGGS